MYYTENDWRAYQEYEYALAHKISLPKFDLSGAKKKIRNTAKSVSDQISRSSSRVSSEVSAKVSSVRESINNRKPVSIAKPGKWTWPNGKNSKEYNHWYYMNFTRFKRMEKGKGSSRTNNRSTKNVRFGGKRWSEMTESERQAYFDESRNSNNSEFFIQNLINRPIYVLTGNVSGYKRNLARNFLADCAYLKTAKQTVQRKLSNGAVDKTTGFKRKTKQMSRQEDLNQVNPGFYNWNTNTKNNCMLCTTTYDLRRRGYDVTANKATHGFETEALTDWYPNAEIKTVKTEPIPQIEGDYITLNDEYWAEQPERAKKNAENLLNELEKQPEGARGNLMVTWAGFSGGHSMAYEIVNGEVMILDGQSNTIYDSESEIMDLLSNCDGDLQYARLDNVDVNPEAIKRASKS